MGKKNRGYQPPPRPPGPVAPAFSAADPPREALPPPPPVPVVQPVVERIQDLLTQFVGVVNRLGDELSPVRIATAVERQIGVTPSVIQDAVIAQRDLRESIGDVQRKLTQVDTQLVGLGSRATTEQVRSAIETAMQPELLRVGHRIEQVRTALDALTQRTSSGQISEDVQTAASELTKQYRVELESKLTRLQQAFDFLDNQSTELRNLIDYCAATVNEVLVQPFHLPPRFVGAAVSPKSQPKIDPPSAAAPVASASAFRNIADEVQELEQRRMREALEATRGNQKKAAQLIGMPLRTFVSKLKQYGLRED